MRTQKALDIEALWCGELLLEVSCRSCNDECLELKGRTTRSCVSVIWQQVWVGGVLCDVRRMP